MRAALDKIGVEPQVRRIGKYKSAGDQLLREDMSEPQKEQLSALLEDLYTGFVDGVAKSRGKTEEQVTGHCDCYRHSPGSAIYLLDCSVVSFKPRRWTTPVEPLIAGQV